MITFERREYSFLPNVSSLIVGDVVTALGSTQISNGPLTVLDTENTSGVVRVLFSDQDGGQYWVTLAQGHEVTLQPPF